MPLKKKTAYEAIRSREYNVPFEGLKGALHEIFNEGLVNIPLGIVSGIALIGLGSLLAPLLTTAPVIGEIAAAAAKTELGLSAILGIGAIGGGLLATSLTIVKGALEGTGEARKHNALMDHYAEIARSEVQSRMHEMDKNPPAPKKPAFVDRIIQRGSRGPFTSHVRDIMHQREQQAASNDNHQQGAGR